MTREEVMHGLRRCIVPYAAYICEKCSYFEKYGLSECVEHLMKDAHDLLKEMEPRVMTVEELCRARGKPAWFEARNGRLYTGWVLIYDVQDGMGITGTRVGVTEPGHVTIWPAVELYGSKWRCWTSEPTEEQRRATPWA